MFSPSIRSIPQRKCGYVCLSCQLNKLDQNTKRRATTAVPRESTSDTAHGPSPWISGPSIDDFSAQGNRNDGAGDARNPSEAGPTGDSLNVAHRLKSKRTGVRRKGDRAPDPPGRERISIIVLSRLGQKLSKARSAAAKTSPAHQPDVSLDNLLKDLEIQKTKIPVTKPESRLLEGLRSVWKERPVEDIVTDITTVSGKPRGPADNLLQDFRRLGLIEPPSKKEVDWQRLVDPSKSNAAASFEGQNHRADPSKDASGSGTNKADSSKATKPLNKALKPLKKKAKLNGTIGGGKKATVGRVVSTSLNDKTAEDAESTSMPEVPPLRHKVQSTKARVHPSIKVRVRKVAAELTAAITKHLTYGLERSTGATKEQKAQAEDAEVTSMAEVPPLRRKAHSAKARVRPGAKVRVRKIAARVISLIRQDLLTVSR